MINYENAFKIKFYFTEIKFIQMIYVTPNRINNNFDKKLNIYLFIFQLKWLYNLSLKGGT